MNNHELQFIAWCKSTPDLWAQIEADGYIFRQRFPFTKEAADSLKEECFFNLEDENPFSEAFMTKVNLDDVCTFFIESQNYPSWFEEEFEKIEQYIALKERAGKQALDHEGKVIGFYLSANGLRNMEVGND